MTLYGEGFGPKIQNGGKYVEEPDFVLFDVSAPDEAARVDEIWLRRENVQDIATQIGVRVVPQVGPGGPLSAAVALARKGFNSDWGDFPAEGLVMRPPVELRDRHGHRIITKIKTKDFRSEQKAPAQPEAPSPRESAAEEPQVSETA